MKKLLLLLAFFAGSLFVMSQSFELSTPEGDAITNGSTINVIGESTETLAAHAYVKNISDDTKRVLLKKVIILDVENSMNTFCWAGSCYGPDTYLSPSSTELLPGASATDFAGDYMANGTEDIASIMYVWFDEDNVNDSVFIYVNFNTAAEKTLAITDDNGIFIDGQTIQVEGTDEAEIVMESIRLINFKFDNADVKVMKMINAGDTVAGSSNSFWWGGINTPDIYESGAVTINSAETDYEFSATLTTNETIGVSTISYKFFDANNTDDYVTITVEFDAKETGITEGIELASISDAYPNPADKMVSFDVNMIQTGTNARVIIRNLLGEIVKEEIILNNSKSLNMNISDLDEGMYVYSLIVNDKIESTKKLVVRH